MIKAWGERLAALPWILAGLGALGLLLYTVAGRLGYPYDLEWMEGGLLTHALRVTEGKGLYVEPSADFIPFIYPPLYTYVIAALSPVFGLGYALGRGLSLLGTLAGAGALIAAVRGEGGRWPVGIGAAGLFLATYDEGGTFFDLVRADGLLIGLLGWALVCMRQGHLRAGGLLLTAAYATKHNAAAFGLVPLLWLAWTQGRGPALRFLAWSVGPAVLFTGLMLLEGDGLFLTYILGVPATHGIDGARAFPQAEVELWQAMPIALTVAALGGLGLLVRDLRGGRPIPAAAAYWGGQVVVGVVLCALMRGHVGGYVNVLIPGFWLGALVCGLLLSALWQRLPAAPVGLGLGAVVLLQVWTGRWSPTKYLPTARDRAAGDAVVAAIAAEEGPVLAPWFPWYAVLAGKEPGLHLIGLWDIDHPGTPFASGRKVLDEALAEQRYAAVFSPQGDLKHGLKTFYQSAGSLPVTGDAMKTRTGWRVVPRTIWRPIKVGKDSR